MVLKSKAKHAAIAVPLKKPFTFTNKPLVVQYEVNLQNGQECGGAYIKVGLWFPHNIISSFRNFVAWGIVVSLSLYISVVSPSVVNLSKLTSLFHKASVVNFSKLTSLFFRKTGSHSFRLICKPADKTL